MNGLVSVGLFETLDNVSVVDCSKYHANNLFASLLAEPDDHVPSPGEIEEAVWTHIDHAFSEPVTDNDSLPDYVPTQILAELFRTAGHDGVLYKSKLTRNGYNLAFFNPAIAKQLCGRLYKTEEVQFKFGDDPEDEYFINDDGVVVRMEISDVQPVAKT
jgi:hypothetical protein